MEKQKLCLCANEQFGPPIREQIPMIRDAGFDEIFFPCRPGLPVREWIQTARAAGVGVQSLHAPFGGCADLWDEDEAEARKALDEILACIRLCSETGVPIAVSHVYIGFDGRSLPKERGLDRYALLVREAERCGVTLAFENTEGEEYLDAVLRAFAGEPHVGFCLDTGHEMCYNRSADLLAKYGKQLVCTHLNDNLGIRSRDGVITWHDDLHLLPFDGIADWEEIAARLAREGYTGTLTFELNTGSKPGRHENDLYAAMPLPAYLAECYKRACRVRKLAEKQLQKR